MIYHTNSMFCQKRVSWQYVVGKILILIKVVNDVSDHEKYSSFCIIFSCCWRIRMFGIISRTPLVVYYVWQRRRVLIIIIWQGCLLWGIYHFTEWKWSNNVRATLRMSYEKLMFAVCLFLLKQATDLKQRYVFESQIQKFWNERLLETMRKGIANISRYKKNNSDIVTDRW